MKGLEHLLPQLALLPDLQRLYVLSGMSPVELESVVQNKPTIVALLRHTQMDKAGIYVFLPRALEDAIRCSPALALSIEVTAPTRFSMAERVNARTIIGRESWSMYRGRHPEVVARSAPRVRTLSVYLNRVGPCCFDMDTMPAADKSRLLHVVLAGKLIVGHNLTADLAWLFAETAARPRYVADVMLLIRHKVPSILLRPFKWAVSPDFATKARAIALMRKHRGRPAATLDYIGSCLKLPRFNNEFANRSSWALSLLSDDHRQYCVDKLATIIGIFSNMFPRGLGTSVQEIEAGAPAYGSYAVASLRLAEAHVHGVPFDIAACGGLRQMRVASLSEETARDGLTNNPAAQAEITSLKSYAQAAKSDGKIHSLITFETSTGRTVSRTPSLQNLPRDPAWRSLIQARPGYQILSVDYIALELRIAAALAGRAISDITDRLRSGFDNDWFLKFVSIGRRLEGNISWPRDTGRGGLDWYRSLIVAASQRVFGRGQQTMKSALQIEIDLHLITAVDFARRADKLHFTGSPLNWLINSTKAQRDELKEQLTGERQAAKACNFGLLYGMSASGLHRQGCASYGLTWTPEEAAAARDAWFALYPEISIWHLWTRYCQSRTIPSSQLVLWDDEAKQTSTPKFPIRLFESTTLAGRPVLALGDRKQALSYQGQGTGADLLALAISMLPVDVAQLMLLPVHDELVFEVRKSELEATKGAVESAMLAAGNAILGQGFPIEVSASVGDTWN